METFASNLNIALADLSPTAVALLVVANLIVVFLIGCVMFCSLLDDYLRGSD